MIETVHQALLQTRTRFPDAACLFVCRPGGSDNYTRDEGSAQAQEDRHVHLIAKQIQLITGEKPTVVTHRDQDAIGKIAAFRRGLDPYLVAVNMVSEGCDIPRLRAVAFCRYTTSEMLFRQIVGRALRMHQPEDGTAAQIYLPAFPILVEFAERLYSEAQEGIRDRRCHRCGAWPCECPCPVCAKSPCECAKAPRLFAPEPMLLAIDATPISDGGHVGSDHVPELYVGYAMRITQDHPAHQGDNHTQLGHALKLFQQIWRADEKQRQQPSVTSAPAQTNPAAEREKLQRRINRHVRQLAVHVYGSDYAKAYINEIQKPFGAQFAVILNTWSVDRLRDVADRVEKRIVEVFRHG